MDKIDKSARAALQSYVRRIDSIDEERAGLADDRKQVFAEAKAAGFDTKIIRKVLQIRKREPDEVRDEMMLVDTYCRALGMEGTPLGDFAEARKGGVKVVKRRRARSSPEGVPA